MSYLHKRSKALEDFEMSPHLLQKPQMVKKFKVPKFNECELDIIYCNIFYALFIDLTSSLFDSVVSTNFSQRGHNCYTLFSRFHFHGH